MQTIRQWLSALLAAVMLSGCGGSGVQPQREDVERAMRAAWETSGSNFAPRTSIEFNEIKFGSTHPANEQDVIDGIPPGGEVTAALVDFTVRTYHSDTTKAVRRKREAAVYLDKFGEWAVMTGQVRGEDSTADEPAQE